MENPRVAEADKLLLKIMIAGCIGLVALIAIDKAEKREEPVNAYIEQFVRNNGCLAGTSYGPESGAMININETENGQLLSVMPRSANFTSPSVLFLGVIPNGFAQSPDFYPTDYVSAALLEEKGCVDPNQGS